MSDELYLPPHGMSQGLIPRDYTAEPLGEGYAGPMEFELIPRAEWPDRIADMERSKSRLTDLADFNGLTVLNQNGTNLCWCNGVVRCVELLRLVQGETPVRLSPASVGGPLTGYRNVGGWGSKALKYVVENGIVPASDWPCNAIDRKYDTEATRKLRALYQCDDWYDVPPRNFDAMMTCVLLRMPCAVAFNWWSHLVCAAAPKHENGKFGIVIDNSWGTSWGVDGRSVLWEGKGTPDECLAPKVVTAS